MIVRCAGSRVRYLFLVAFVMGAVIQIERELMGGEPPPAFGAPLPNLSPAELARFLAGKASFEEVEGISDGIGPVFNDISCAKCHDGMATGGGSDVLSVRFGTRENGTFDPLFDLGGPTIQSKGIGPIDDIEFVGETVPQQATIVAKRRATQVFGFGLVDAVPDSTLESLALWQEFTSPDTAGRPNFVTDLRTGKYRVGRFGWKAQLASLYDFSGDAYKDEMGITVAGFSTRNQPGVITPFFPGDDGRLLSEENAPQGDVGLLDYNPLNGPNEPDDEDLILFTDFMTFLAPPPAVTDNSPSTRRGIRTFEDIGCADCHVPTLRTGAHASRALRSKEFHPYSDFLLHDMGSLGDGIEQGIASGSEMRTAPLWGLRTQPAFLHDGRAATIEEAILAHDGQGKKASDRFRRLAKKKRQDLLEFLGSL